MLAILSIDLKADVGATDIVCLRGGCDGANCRDASNFRGGCGSGWSEARALVPPDATAATADVRKSYKNRSKRCLVTIGF